MVCSQQTLPDWEAAQAGSFTIKFRTTEPHGLLVFSKAQGTSFVRYFCTKHQLFFLLPLFCNENDLILERRLRHRINRRSSIHDHGPWSWYR